MHFVFVLGTRPEIIKLSSLIRACIRERISYTLIHTNQHYAESMDKAFFETFGLPSAHFNLGVGSAPAGVQVGLMLQGITPILQSIQPDCVIVQGDTNSALAGGLATSKAEIPVVHVEAGLRSFDRGMPEETNRILLDHLSSFWFCPSALQVELLAREGITGPQVQVTGNTGIDALLDCVALAQEGSSLLGELDLAPEAYLLLTCHRPSNTDDLVHFTELMGAVQDLAEELDLAVVMPVHPRLGAKHRAVIQAQSRLMILEPLGYLDMLAVLQGAALVLTDSGGVQEEACVLRRRCLVLRTTTERPEALVGGGALLVPDVEASNLIGAAQALRSAVVDWDNPFGDGQAGRRIIDNLVTALRHRGC